MSSIVLRNHLHAIDKVVASAIRNNPYVRNIRTGVRVASAMARNKYVRGAARYGYRRFKRSFNSRKARRETAKRRQQRARARKIGHRRTQGTAKTSVQKQPTVQNLDTRNLEVIPCTEIQHTVANQSNRRQRNIVYIRGIKICMQLKNLLPNDAVTVNWALVAPKDGTNVTTDAFFRSAGENVRSKDFSNALTNNEFHCLPINPDKLVILTHKRFKLDGSSTASGIRSLSPNFRQIDHYQEIKRQLRYETTTDNTTEKHPIYMVMWVDKFLEESGVIGFADAVSRSLKIITYFSEPKDRS